MKVIFPCNQFGAQEPGSGSQITSFVKRKGFEGIIIQKSNVNGPNTSKTFRYLKHVTGR
jgi:glutathione peroxidase